MNILFVSAILPYPLYSGGQIRVYNLLKRLSGKHNIHLYSFIRDQAEASQLKNLDFCASVDTFYRGRAWRIPYLVKAITSSYSFLLSTYENEKMRRQIQKDMIDKKIDLVHIEPGYVWPSLPDINKPLVVAEHNVEHQIYQGYTDKVKIPFVKHFLENDVLKMVKWEKKIWDKASHIIAVSKPDAAFITKSSKTQVSIVPNAVDLETFSFKPKEIKSESFTCMFVGNFRWMQNIDAVKTLLEEIWPKILTRFPMAKLRIVGKHFPKTFEKMLNNSVILVEDASDIAFEYHQADILLVPISIGGGTKYKILEAMACGVPVVSSFKGLEGLPVKKFEQCYVATKIEDWVSSIEFILKSPDKNKIILKQARAMIEENYDWNNIAKKLDAVWSMNL